MPGAIRSRPLTATRKLSLLKPQLGRLRKQVLKTQEEVKGIVNQIEKIESLLD